MAVIQEKSLLRIKEFHKLSQIYNKKLDKNHQSRLFELMDEHVEEIKELAEKKDKHFLVETGDLIMLCFEVLIENGVSVDEILLKCFNRFETKLPRLLEE